MQLIRQSNTLGALADYREWQIRTWEANNHVEGFNPTAGIPLASGRDVTWFSTIRKPVVLDVRHYRLPWRLRLTVGRDAAAYARGNRMEKTSIVFGNFALSVFMERNT